MTICTVKAGKWTHAICKSCYAIQEPGRQPITIRDVDMELCCFCGKATWDRIFYRKDPKLVHNA